MRAYRDEASITLSLKNLRGRQSGGDEYIRGGKNARAYRPRYPVRPGPSMAVHGALMHIMGGMCTCRGSQLFDTAAGRFAIYVPPLSPARIARIGLWPSPSFPYPDFVSRTSSQSLFFFLELPGQRHIGGTKDDRKTGEDKETTMRTRVKMLLSI